MKLYVDAAVVKQIIEQDFGNIASFAESWAARDLRLGRASPLARDGKTIYGWLADGLPRQRETVFDFFAMLGVDPISIIDIERNGLPENFGRLRLSFLFGGLAAGAFRSLFELYRPGPAWPESRIALDFFERDWSVQDFTHGAAEICNRYATIHVKPGVASDRPAAWHIAYRRVQNADAMWRPYGSIIMRKDLRILIHENGNMQREDSATQVSGLRFQTFFGPSPVEFRLASLTPFSIALQFPDDRDDLLRFIG